MGLSGYQRWAWASGRTGCGLGRWNNGWGCGLCRTDSWRLGCAGWLGSGGPASSSSLLLGGRSCCLFATKLFELHDQQPQSCGSSKKTAPKLPGQKQQQPAAMSRVTFFLPASSVACFRTSILGFEIQPSPCLMLISVPGTAHYRWCCCKQMRCQASPATTAKERLLRRSL